MASLLPKLLPSVSCCLAQQFKSSSPIYSHNLLYRSFITTSSVGSFRTKGPVKFKRYNELIFPPQTVDEKPRPAYVCHSMENVKYSPLKLWYVACLVRGMSIDEALRQLDYVHGKGAAIVKATLLEAQEIAVQQHNVEFRSNLWVAESFSGKGVVVKGLRRHARKRFGIIHYRHSHYFVRLEEGKPPEHYYKPEEDGPTMLQDWIQKRREARIFKTI